MYVCTREVDSRQEKKEDSANFEEDNNREKRSSLFKSSGAFIPKGYKLIYLPEL